MIRRLSHAHRPFSLHEFVSVMPNLAIYFLHYLLYTAFVIIRRFLFEKRLRIRMSSHTCAPKGRQAFPTRSRLWCQTQRATKSWLLCQLPCVCAAIKKKKKEVRERGQGPKSRIIKPCPSLCFRTVSHSIGSLGTELFCRAPSALPKAEKLSKCKLKCVCFSVESQNDLSLLNGISYMCWVRWFIMGGNGN